MPGRNSPVQSHRYAQGMTFDEYVAYIATPENLGREGSGGAPRRDFSAFMGQAFQQTQLNEAQVAALRWLVTQPEGPGKMLVISEEWSSDCRRDVPTFARIAAATGMELRIFTRDGQKFSTANAPGPDDGPNADIVAEFLNHKNGQTWQSIPVCAFFTLKLEYLYHFCEYPAIYDKDRLVNERIRSPRPGETPEATRARADQEFG